MRILEGEDDFIGPRKWAIMTVKEAKEYGYGCEDCLDTIKRAKRMKCPVLGYQTTTIAPKWEIVAIWNVSNICAQPVSVTSHSTQEDVK